MTCALCPPLCAHPACFVVLDEHHHNMNNHRHNMNNHRHYHRHVTEMKESEGKAVWSQAEPSSTVISSQVQGLQCLGHVLVGVELVVECHHAGACSMTREQA